MDSEQVVAVAFMVLTGCMVAAGVVFLKRVTAKTIVPPIRQAKQSMADWDKACTQRYNNLPPLGQAREDKRIAQIAKYGGVAAYGIGGAILLSIAGVTGAWIIPLALGGRWVRNNWRDNDAAIKDADRRRDEILNPPASLGEQASVLSPVRTRNYWDPN
jgi:hypothetical protein